MYKVSVIVPMYNAELYIRRCVVSLFTQTLSDIEYIFVDDGSTDNTLNVLETTINSYPNRKNDVIIIKNETNCGVALSRSKGVKSSTGEFLIHCDSDDWLDVTAYEKMYNKAIETGSDVVFCSYTFSDGKSNIDERHIVGGNGWSAFTDDIPLWCKLVKRNIFFDNNFLYTEAGMCEDRVYSFQIAYYAHKIEFVEEILYYYFVNNSSLCLNLSEKACLSRFEQTSANQHNIEYLANKFGMIAQYSNYVFHMKYTAKHQLAPLVRSNEYYKLWKNSYPEVNFRSVLFNEGIKNAIKYLTVKFRIYPLL